MVTLRHAATMDLADWQRDLAQRVADALQRGERVQLSWPRRHGRRALLAAVDAQMESAGWTVLAPGVYEPPATAPTTE